MKKVDSQYHCLPFWSWNDELDEKELCAQVDWMASAGVGGFFMHARGGLSTPYLGEKWFRCIQAAGKEGTAKGLLPYAYDENGWPSGFAGGALLSDIKNHDCYLTHQRGHYDPKALASFDTSGEALVRVYAGDDVLNVYQNYSGSTADICQKEVVAKFIALTHEQYRKNDNFGLKGFFTDEPQYYRWATAFTTALFPYFKEHYNEDLTDRIGLLFVEKEGYRDFRYKYWKAMQDLMLHSYSEQIYHWCEAHGYTFTGHYVEETALFFQMECCGGIMPFYEYETIPGIDWLARFIGNDLSPRQVASVAEQLGKKQVLCEMFACSGWDVTPLELKQMAEYLYVNGVNLMCQHLLPYHEDGQRKRDYPAHYSLLNPWINKGFKDFNDYFAVLGEILSNSHEVVDVAVLQPIRSAYFDFKREDEKNWCGVKDLDQSFEKFLAELRKRHILYHFVDETLLAKYGKVEGDALVMGKCRYHYWVFPRVVTMDKSTEALLQKFVNRGGKVALYEGKPTYLESHKFSYPYLKNTISLDQIQRTMPYEATDSGDVLLDYREDETGKRFYYLVNISKGDCAFSLKDKAGAGFLAYDIFKDETTPCSSSFTLHEGESRLLYVSPEKLALPKAKSLKRLTLSAPFHLAKPVANYLTLDTCAYSFDGKNYSKTLPHLGVFDELLHLRYKGPLYLAYHFLVENAPSSCTLLAELRGVKGVKLNGVPLEQIGVSPLESHLAYFKMDGLIHSGDNEIVVEQDYFQSEAVYYALFGENVTESLKNCLVYDRSIEPVYLKGDFGVAGTFQPGKASNLLLGEAFRVTQQPQNVSSLIEGGFPFFRGDIVLEKNIVVDDTDYELVVPERFQCLEVSINGRFAGKMMFSHHLDLSNFLKVGANVITLTLTVSNRNLLGPSHTIEQEDISLGPQTFELPGSWKNGESPLYRPSYSFVKTLI